MRIRNAGILLLLVILTGCASTEQSYKVLSFFFDGVPLPDQRSGQQQQQGANQSNRLAKQRPSQHGPYAAKLCDGCHDKRTNTLVAPKEELCFRCHEFAMNKKYVHGPLASGGCLVCHDPHSSGNKYLLLSQAEQFCFYCHSRVAIYANPMHKEATASCTTCHNAHMSDERYLLK